MSMIDLTIVIPTYKEEGRIGDSLDQLAAYLKGNKHSVEVLVVDADSPDKTIAEVRSRAKKFKHFRVLSAGPKPVGKAIKGKQVRDGIFEAAGRYVVFMDADLATPLKYLERVFAAMDANIPVAICVRNLNESHKGIRKIISGFGNFLVQVLLLPGVKDTQCGFKAFEREAAHTIFARQQILGWGFDMEVLAIARKLGYGIELIDVPDWHDVKEGSKLGGNSAIKAALQVFLDLLNIKLGTMIGRYNKPTYKHAPLHEHK
ncbi:glycosyltransferase [bacterium]|nr:glycosyltransferase [bacterium]